MPGALRRRGRAGREDRRPAGLGPASGRRPRCGRGRLPAQPAARRPPGRRRRQPGSTSPPRGASTACPSRTAATPTRSSPPPSRASSAAWSSAASTPTTPRTRQATPRRARGGVVRRRARAARDRRDPRRRRRVPGGAGRRDKAGTFVNWEGRPRPFEAVLGNPASLPDLRVLAGIAEELGRPLGLPHRRRGAGADGGDGAVGRRPRHHGDAGGFQRRAATPRALVLATWKQLVDNGSMQDGDERTPPPRVRPVARVSQKVVRRARPDGHTDR